MINMLRGVVVNYDDLVEVLSDGIIVVVGLDVIDLELFLVGYFFLIQFKCVILLYMGINIVEIRVVMSVNMVKNIFVVLN